MAHCRKDITVMFLLAVNEEHGLKSPTHKNVPTNSFFSSWLRADFSPSDGMHTFVKDFRVSRRIQEVRTRIVT